MIITPEIEIADFGKLSDRVVEIAGGIRELSNSQAELWRQLPLLALQGAHRDSGSTITNKLYEYGLLQVSDYSSGLYGTFVDCDNGNILSLDGMVEPDSLASDAEVVAAWLPDGRVMDAEQWLESYRVFAANTSQRRSDESSVDEQWRKETVARLGLLAVFSRSIAS